MNQMTSKLPQQQNILREIDFDHSNVINTEDFIKNNDDLISVHLEMSTNKVNLQSNISDERFSNKTEIVNDI